MDTERLGFVVLAGLALGSSAVLSRFGLQDIAPLSLVALRLGVATVAFLLTLRVLRPGFPRHPRPLLDIAIVGLTTMAIPLSAFTLALQFVSSAVLSSSWGSSRSSPLCSPTSGCLRSVSQCGRWRVYFWRLPASSSSS